MKYLIILLMLVGCAKAKPEPISPPSATQASKEADVVARIPRFLDNGWIVSRGTNDNHGDSLFFTGLAMYGLSCADGEAETSAVEAMLHSGSYYRYPGDTDAVSLDQRLGLYRGIAARVGRCAEWGRFAAALGAVPAGGLPVEFSFVEDKLRAKLGLTGEPSAERQAALEGEVASWAADVNATHAACFRIHISLVALQIIEELGGKISSLGRTAFCNATRGTNLPTVEAYCGRQALDGWLDSFQYNVYQYRHQRCLWEAPDGNGEEQPAIDYLVAYMDKTK